MGEAVNLPVQFGAGHYIVSENTYLSREVGVIAKGAGKLPAGMILARLTAAVGDQKVGEYVPYVAGGASGAGTASAILYEATDARLVAVKRTLTVREAEVQRAALTFAGTPNDADKNAAYVALAVNHVVMR